MGYLQLYQRFTNLVAARNENARFGYAGVTAEWRGISTVQNYKLDGSILAVAALKQHDLSLKNIPSVSAPTLARSDHTGHGLV